MHNRRWTTQKIEQRIALVETLVYRRKQALSPFHCIILETPLEDPPVGVDIDVSGWQLVLPETYWAASRTNFVLRGSFHIPTDWSHDLPLALYLPLGKPGSFSHPEALIYVDGMPYATCDRHHQEVRLDPDWHDGQSYKIAMHGWTGNNHREGDSARLLMHTCYVVQIDPTVRTFVILARNALKAAQVLDETDPIRSNLLNGLDAAFKLLDLREPIEDAFYASVPAAHKALQEAVAAAGPALDVDITAVGHAHIDVAWLWTLGQTRRKAGRTFHTVMRLMEEFPDYHFTQSQPQLYDYVKQDYPELFEQIKTRIAEGRWETIGGMWVEADCNLSGPESLARQFLLGRSFFRKHFGSDVETPVLWLPDVFGYAWNLPQLIKEAGLEYFFTIKIGWSQYNRLPYDTFWWQGLDGTRVLTHFSTTPEGHDYQSRATYNAMPTAGTALYTWKNFQQRDESNRVLMSYGYGDGGGGPTREMLENLEVLAEFPGIPHTRMGKADAFFRQVESESGEVLPVWNGELYLELHRGTYTTQSRNKRANRKSEFLLHDAEALATMAGLLDPAYQYPYETLRKAWELVCLNQFHDIIPGSSITPVYTESLEQYAEIRQMGEAVRNSALKVITQRHNGDVVIVNTTGFVRSDLAFWPEILAEGFKFVRTGGVLSQPTASGTWLAVGEVAPHSVVSLRVEPGEAEAPATELSVSINHLENVYVRVEIDDKGDITRIFDKYNQREVLPEGAIANQFRAFEDRPLNWDAWDIDIFYDDKVYFADPAESITVIEEGPLHATIEIKRQILNSTYIQRIALSYNSPRIDFSTRIDWQERKTLLKVAFPVDVLAPQATYEIQWGNVERPTHRNTSWDWARFETAAQKWVDLSEGDYGVSLLNDCKYGHDIHDNVISLSLLRGPTAPDPEADQGTHRFAYSLYPHGGRWDKSTITQAYAFNDPLIAVRGVSGTHGTFLAGGMLRAVQGNVIIETVKHAEDGNGIIVRLYESQRRRGTVTLQTGFTVASAWRANIMEENQSELQIDPIVGDEPGSSIKLKLHPYEIATLRLIPTT